MISRRVVATALRFAAVSALFAQLPACAQVSVFVWQENRVDRVVYHYRVTNDSGERLLGFNIGDNSLTGEMQLTVRPVGFVEDESLIPPDMIGFPIPSSSVETPAGWQASLILGDEHSGTTAALRYSVVDNGAGLDSGSLGGFAVALPVASEPYRSGQWLAILERGLTVPGKLLPDPDAPQPTATVGGGGSGCPGTTMQITATLTGNGPWSVRWSDGAAENLTAARTSRAVTPAVTTDYTIPSITDVNGEGAGLGHALATVFAQPAVTTQPASTSIAKRNSATLAVVASGTTPLAYQWYQGISGNTSAPVGTNSASFTTPKLTATTSYWVRISNACGSANSNTATVTVR